MMFLQPNQQIGYPQQQAEWAQRAGSDGWAARAAPAARPLVDAQPSYPTPVSLSAPGVVIPQRIGGMIQPTIPDVDKLREQVRNFSTKFVQCTCECQCRNQCYEFGNIFE
jgi:hypothetical protein